MSILSLFQGAVEVAKAPSFLSGTGRVIVDGTVVVTLLKIAEALISRWKTRKARAQSMTLLQPDPKPGESETCKDHLEQIKDLHEKVAGHGEKIEKLLEFRDRAVTSLERIEGKVDRLLERGGK